jgi:hypothetical protein
MIKTTDISWIAGLLEGEGNFSIKQAKVKNVLSPRINLNMIDEDIVTKVRNIINPSIKIRFRELENRGWKKQYVIRVSGNLAVQWMMTVYCLMGKRRKQQIREVFDTWKTMVGRGNNGPEHRNKVPAEVILERILKAAGFNNEEVKIKLESIGYVVPQTYHTKKGN